ncbi:MAG: hypothetical protein QM628_01530, partial [Propionicimonas sp.]
GLPAPEQPSSPAPAARPAPAPSAKPLAPAMASAGGYVDRPGVDSTADPATVLPHPIVPKF